MKKIVLIPDSFKGTMSSAEVCGIMVRAVKAHYPGCEVVSIPVADGGEGTVDSFLAALGGERVVLPVQGPHGETVEGFYGVLPDGTAVVEMAAAAGLPLAGARPNAGKTTTYGVGQLMLDAIRRGSREIVLGLGGSATNDLGCGAAAAVGVKFYDKDGRAFIPVGETLDAIARIDASGAKAALEGVRVSAMCDIDNPLYGKNGAAHVFAPQKGADARMVESLDQNLRRAAAVIQSELGVAVDALPGGGAAGGMGAGSVAFFGASLQRGIELVLDTVRFDQLVQGADLVFSGEGKLDSQSLCGKVVVGVAQRAKRQGVPTVAVVGDIGGDIDSVYETGVAGIFSTNRVAVPYPEARARAKEDLFHTMDNVLRFVKAVRKDLR